MKRRSTVLFLIIVFLHASGSGQNQPSFDQYHFNQLVINPAYAGSRSSLETNLFFRQQWTKMEGAPQTISAVVHGKTLNDKVGLGMKILQENIGAVNKFQLGLQYAYRIHAGNAVYAIGLDAGATNYQLHFTELSAYLDGDPAFTNQPENTWSPNLGAGIWINTKRFYLGASAPVIFEDTISGAANHDISQLNIFEAYRHYYLSTGILIGNTETFAVKPYTLVKYAPLAPMQIDASMSFIFKNNFWLGGTYRTDNSAGIMAEYFADKNGILQDHIFGFGYAYNFSLGEVQDLFGPTHEFFVTYSFDRHITNFTNPRFF